MTGLGSVLVVIVNYRSARYLPRLLESVLAEASIAAVVVHDNGSGRTEADELALIAKRYPSVRMVLGEVNLGFGGGVQAAVAESPTDTWDAVWVLNPDTAVRSGALRALLESADEHAADLISPLIVRPGDSGQDTVWFAGGDVDLVRGRSTHQLFGRPTSEVPAGYREIGFITGAAPLMRRTAWNRLNGFATHYFLYCEDTDLSIRAATAGLRLGLEPSAVIEHEQGGSTGGGVSPTYCYYTQRNRLWMYRGLMRRIRVAFIEGAPVTKWLLLFPLRSSSRSRQPVRAVISSLRGLIDGLRGTAVGAVIP